MISHARVACFNWMKYAFCREYSPTLDEVTSRQATSITVHTTGVDTIRATTVQYNRHVINTTSVTFLMLRLFICD